MGKRLLVSIKRLFMPDADDGFSLLEVMVAMCIMTIGMLGVAAMFTSSMKAFSSGSNNTGATNAAYHKLNDIRLTDYSSFSAPNLAANFNGAGSVDGYPCTWSTFQVYSGVMKVTVIANWTDALSNPKTPRNHSVTISSLTSGKPDQ